MNNFTGTGILGREPEISYTNGTESKAIARFNLGMQRDFKNAEGRYDYDNIMCVAFGKTAEFIEKYVKAKSIVEVVGQIRSGSYTNKNGIKVHTTEVYVDKVKRLDRDSNVDSNNEPQSQEDPWVNVPENLDELPFK